MPWRRALPAPPALIVGLGWLALWGLCWCLWGNAPAAADEPRLYIVDPARSQVRFSAVSRLMNADGAFGRVAGEVRFDPARPEATSGRVAVDVASIDTGIRMRDNHLRGPDFFDAERHPQATFVVSSVRREAEQWTVSGTLTVRGVTHPIGVPVTLTVVDGALRVVGQLTVNRKAFGVAYDSFLNPIRDEVRVSFDLMATAR